MKLLCDENLMEVTVGFLCQLGHDAVWAKKEGLRSEPDEKIYAYAVKEKRCLITYDVDFSDIRKLEGKEHYGIIRLRINNQRSYHLHPILEEAFKHLEGIDLRNSLVTITDKRVKIRKTSLD